MSYVDCFVLPVPVKNLATYRKVARKAAKIWIEHGALEYRECVGDDLNMKVGLPLPAIVKPKRGETIVFAYVRYKSRAQRDRINIKVASDPRLSEFNDPKKLPFDISRMSWGGFKTIVHA